jgi:small subunit ribosomal protein S8
VNMTDPIADMLTRIRNASGAHHDTVAIPSSTLKVAIARILKEEGFIRDFEVQSEGPKRTLILQLRYTGKRQPVVSEMRRISKPGLRVFAKSREMPKVLGGLGVAIVSTPRGVMTATRARRENIGGEILCYVW